MEAFSRAAGRFAGFFAELNQCFLEREDVLAQSALALLSREHVLLTGPPGTAKSQLARAVLGRIVDAATGQPSLFARQFTENTVLTDLVGAVDFKTLMETGRTEHFTDEGIIGSVHAFLDEVFDGRDMLLRSTLNLLGERELKQGVRTTRGRIECSLMTSNRYLSEVLDESRETLLAFVDRIAFVGFVPKGFSSAEPMRRVIEQNVSGRPSRLSAYLSIQDLDLLQQHVERVHFPEPASDRLVVFLDQFENELMAAVRAIPDFAPSRYLSIRSRVRAARVLKAIVVYRKVVESPERPLEVQRSDFAYLRYVLLQSGPPKALLAKLQQEQDPREARQLKIIQTELEVFERSLARLDPAPWPSRTPPSRQLDPGSLAERPLEELVELLRTADAARTMDEAELTQLSQLVMRRIIERGVSATGAGAEEHAALTALADSLDSLRGPSDPLTRWLRARAASLLTAAAEQQLLAVEAFGEKSPRGAAAITRLSAALEQLQALLHKAEEARTSTDAAGQGRLAEVLSALAGALTNRLREALHLEVEAALGGASGAALDRLRPTLSALDSFETVARQTHPAFESLLPGVAAPLLWPVAAQALAPLAVAPRGDFLSTFDRLWTDISRGELARHVSTSRLLELALTLALEQERALPPAMLPAQGGFSTAGYRELRRLQPRVSLSYLCVQLCLRVDAGSIRDFAERPELSCFARALAALPGRLREALWRLDTARVAQTLTFLEGWLAQVGPGQSQGLFELLGTLGRDEALSRLRLEVSLTEALFPESAQECAALYTRLDRLLPALGRAAAQPLSVD